MQKYKKAALNIAFLTLLFSGGRSLGVMNAYTKVISHNNASQEKLLLETFENDDYDSWKRIVAKRSHLAAVVTKKDFEIFIEARKAARSGNYDLAIKKTEKLESELKLRFLENTVV